MASGIDVASLILAVLPLLVQRCEDYAKGLETIKMIRGRHFRREMIRYAARLGAEGVIFKNSIRKLLEDALAVEVDLATMGTEEVKEMLGRKEVNRVLEIRLGNDCNVYWENLRLLSESLVELQQRLGLNENLGSEFEAQLRFLLSFQETFWTRQLSKFRLIFSHSVYDALLSKINKANSALRMMTDDFVQTRTKHKRNPSSLAQCGYFCRARRSAHALWEALIQRGLWGCDNTHSHRVEISLQEPGTMEHIETAKATSPTLSLVMLSDMQPNEQDPQHCCFGKEIEAVPTVVSSLRVNAMLDSTQQDESSKAAVLPEKQVNFALTSLTTSAIPQTSMPSTKTGQKLSDICAELFLSSADVDVGHSFGYTECNGSQAYRHDLIFVRQLLGDRLTRPLRVALSWPSNIGSQVSIGLGSLCFWTNKLSIAVSLATNLLIFQGNWLREPWTFEDFVVVEEMLEPKNVSPPARIHLEKSFPDCLERFTGTGGVDSARDPSKTLLPLGFALTELALGRRLAELREPEDAGLTESDTDMNTARRHLDFILYERGFTYRSVVERCLFWNGIDLKDLDSEQVQATIYENIARPLLKDFYIAKGYNTNLFG